MIKIYSIAISDLRGKAGELRATLPASILEPWQKKHADLHNESSLIASLAGVWLLWKSGVAGTLAYTENGKPYLSDPDRAISITHTHTHAFCAISDSAEDIGLDAEDLGRLSPHRLPALVKRWFTSEETKKFELDPSEEAFLHIWTRKEALVKLTGDGLRSIRQTDLPDRIATASYRICNTCITLAYPAYLAPSRYITVLSWDKT